MSEIEIVGGILEGYTQVPNELFRTPGIKSRAVHVFGNLRSNRSGWNTNTRNVAESTGLSHNTVMAAVNDLIDLGYIHRVKIPGENGRFPTYRYRVFDYRAQKVGTAPDVENESGNLTQKVSQAPDAKSESYKKNSFKKTKEEDHTPIVPKGTDGLDRFDEFWETYGHKKNRGGAERAWKKAAKHTDPQDIINAAKLFIASQKSLGKHPQYTPYPSTWLNGKRWLDDVELPEELGGFGYDISFDD